ncbi:MAG TPA: ethanolamine permease [Candidatus Acidoferrum sp.]|nr:ethanolamine permease [Candidatus Acidoferrum sp.]
MSDQQSVQGVTYEKVGAEYFEKRGLRRFAGVWSLWALGVGAVISGDFFGWNYGLATGGFGGLFVATLIVSVMYICLCYSLAEMAPALPHTGGAYSFGRTAMGPWGGFLTGLGENMEYVITPGVIIVSVGAYLQSIFGTPPEWQWVWWVGVFVIFVGLNIWGVELSFKFTIFITFLAMAILVFFFLAALSAFDFSKLALNIGIGPDGAAVALPDGGGPFMPFGWTGVFASLPFAIWFLLAIEQLPLAAEESHAPQRDMPKGLLWGILTLVILGFLTLLFNSAVPPGASVLGASAQPLLDGLIGIFGEGLGTKVLALLAVAGLIASFHTIIYAYGRNIYSLSRAGYFPRWMSLTHGERKTPHVALILGGVVSLGLALLMTYAFPGTTVGAALLNLAVFGAVISYAMQGLSFYILRRDFPSIERPYRSPLGSAGALVCTLIAVICLIAMFLNEAYRPGLYGAVVWYVLGVLYFAFIGRHKLVLSPEEEFAMSHRKA